MAMTLDPNLLAWRRIRAYDITIRRNHVLLHSHGIHLDFGISAGRIRCFFLLLRVHHQQGSKWEVFFFFFGSF